LLQIPKPSKRKREHEVGKNDIDCQLSANCLYYVEANISYWQPMGTRNTESIEFFFPALTVSPVLRQS
ncbi:hypothetical protein STEG23_017072, partial [Scotinomys teguina]